MVTQILTAAVTALMWFSCGMSSFMAMTCRAEGDDTKLFRKYVLDAVLFGALGVTDLILLVRR